MYLPRPAIGILALGLAGISPVRAEQANSGEETESLFQSARAHLTGTGVVKDAAKAFDLMKTAAAQGHIEALGGVGYFYATGTAVDRDRDTAIEWYRRGAGKGSAKAQLNLGKLLITENESLEAVAEGVTWIRKSAEQHLAEGLVEYGDTLMSGKHGVANDPMKAFTFLHEAAELGHADAQNMLGFMLERGLTGPSDAEAAEAWYRKAAKQRLAKAQANLGRLLNPHAAERATRIEAIKWLVIAANQNEITAKKSLAEAIETIEPAEVDEARSLAAKESPGPTLREQLKANRK